MRFTGYCSIFAFSRITFSTVSWLLNAKHFGSVMTLFLFAEIRCPVIPIPRNGNIVCPDGNVYGANCYMVCKSGYSAPEPVRGIPILCQLDGTWTADTDNLLCKSKTNFSWWNLKLLSNLHATLALNHLTKICWEMLPFSIQFFSVLGIW